MRHTASVQHFRVSQAAELLAVSDDTVRRWLEVGRLTSEVIDGKTVIPGVSLAEFALAQADNPDGDPDRRTSVSARNSMSGLVTRVRSDPVMSQVEMICGPYRIVSLMSTEAVTDLGLAPGVLAVASVKATNVVIEAHP